MLPPREKSLTYRTMESWYMGERESPLYTRLMMQECLGLFTRLV